ncbi:post-transcriptional regulator [Tumebacillus permanentifrigoris]|uniref:ComN-like post-transcriptional regulator n=1 Tax=Tumebacillus permanentifrigoris TaxID=378543 RepID=A0A316D5N2_9BACL|nr:post-transcriptional regulator [Tumebacillus permanentifrigoris]PWK08980.1 ComN-like post-transcriptional regulator [Tumebacillus permanentifrigoris]
MSEAQHPEQEHPEAEAIEAVEPERNALNSEQRLTEAIEQVCTSKAEEFHLLGYEQVTGAEVWECVSQKYKMIPPLHRVINDVLTLKTNVFMNWLLIRAYKQPDADDMPPPPKRHF